eukprot:3024855-Rhodomonas_salina.4
MQAIRFLLQQITLFANYWCSDLPADAWGADHPPPPRAGTASIPASHSVSLRRPANLFLY